MLADYNHRSNCCILAGCRSEINVEATASSLAWQQLGSGSDGERPNGTPSTSGFSHCGSGAGTPQETPSGTGDFHCNGKARKRFANGRCGRHRASAMIWLVGVGSPLFVNG